MGDCEFPVTNHEVQHHLAAAARHIFMALKACGNLKDDVKQVLSDLNSCLPNELVDQSSGRLLMDMKDQIRHPEEVIMRWESYQGMIWDSGSTEASRYLDAVAEIQRIICAVEGLPTLSDGWQKELSLRAHCILQIAMSKLEEELMHILVQNKQCYEPEYMSFRSYMEDLTYDDSFLSVEDCNVEPMTRADDSRSSPEQCLLNLIQPEMVYAVKSIATVMFASKHDKEFCQAFVRARKDALEEYLYILEMKQFTVEDIFKMDWKSLSREIKKWEWALRIIVRVYLKSERWLCDQILGEFGQASLNCSFVEITWGAMLQFLNFGEVIAMAPRQPDRLFRILNVYETLADLVLDIDAVFIEESGNFIRLEFHSLLGRLGDYIKGAFREFRNCIASDRPRKAFTSSVHPFTNYAMNYIRTLTSYRDTLNFLLCHEEADGLEPSLEPENGEEDSLYRSCPLARHIRLVASLLEDNLESRSKLLKDEPLQHIFMMNNIHYMVQKIKDSDLRQHFGDEWVRKQNGNFQHHANDYIRTTWSSALFLLKDSERSDRSLFYGSSLREKCRKFIEAFEEIYKNQTGWIIPDPQLREDIQISTSQRIIQAYRSFLGKNSERIGDRYIKYNADDLENLVLDFFEGSPRLLRSSRRR
ncbi:hypothetical protein SAY86_004847 [Trapa natans]|uniref:Exocyst subunit Exo70 family protein n=1 Tax=Trapa natans TaxID=22666 RepID=A0AAN7MZA6_TRANT|nr:hypothetical protein SAY86_004847 [Trapa natans]